MTPESVARIVESQDEAAFTDLLRAADADFRDDAFESAIADALRADPVLIDHWYLWSGDQRWTPSAYVEGLETGWYDAGYEHVRAHPDRAAAAADFIHRMATWLARREVIEIER